MQTFLKRRPHRAHRSLRRVHRPAHLRLLAAHTTTPDAPRPHPEQAEQTPAVQPSRLEASLPWTLLLVVGFDAASRRALRCAQEQAVAMSMSLQLLHVVAGEPALDPGEQDRALRSTLRAWAEFEGGLLLSEESLSIAHGAMGECIIQACRPGVALVVAAQPPEPGVDLSALKEQLQQGCPCPVSLQVHAAGPAPPDAD